MASSGDNTKRLGPGDRWLPTADGINDWNAAAAFLRSQQRGGGAVVNPTAFPNNPAIVTVKNNSGEDRFGFDVLGIDGILIAPGDNIKEFLGRYPLVGVVPAVPDHTQRFCVLLQPVADGRLAKAAVAGAVPVYVRVTSGTDVASITTVGIEDGEAYALVPGPGVPVLYVDSEVADADPESGDEYHWAVVNLGGGGSTIQAVELKTSLGDSETAQGWPLTWDEDSEEYPEPDYDDEDALIAVFDVGAAFQSLGYDDTGDGQRGAIVFIDQKGVVLSGQQQARRLKAKTKGKINGTATGKIDGITAIDGGQVPALSAQDDLTVNNPRAHYYADDADVELEEDGAGGYNLRSMKQITFRGTLSGSLSVGGSANANLTGIGTETVYDCLMKAGSSAIASGKKIVATWYSDAQKFYVDEAECP